MDSDLIVVGTGTAAMVAAVRVRKAGRTVAVIDQKPFGGTCALRGCDPKKMLVSGEEVIYRKRRMRGHGVDGEVRIDWPELIRFKRSFTDPVPEKHERRYHEAGIATFHGVARFTALTALRVGDDELTGRNFLIASGAKPVTLGIPGEEHLVDNEGFLALESLPRRIALVGGGYIAAEFSHIAARAGAEVTVIQRWRARSRSRQHRRRPRPFEAQPLPSERQQPGGRGRGGRCPARAPANARLES